MKRLTNLITFLLFAGSLSAQTYSQEFGKVGKDDIEMKTYSADPDAEAVVMFDYGDSRFVEAEAGYDVDFERRTRIKVLNDAGVKFAEFEIPFYTDNNVWERISDLEGYTYNLENGVLSRTPLDLSTVYTEKLNEHWSVKKFAMPNVKPGSIVECRYKLRSEYVFNLRDWEFQWKIPVIYSEYTVHINPFYYYVYALQGTSRTDVFESYEDRAHPHRLPYATSTGHEDFIDVVYRFGMKNVPAFRDEEFITSREDYIQKIDFQLAQVNMYNGVKREIMTTWEELVKSLEKDEDFGRCITKAEKTAAKIFDIKELQSLPVEERFDRVINYVKTNFSWDGQNSKYASKSLDQLMKEKLGNNADLNLFAVGLLHAAGIEATPIISSTRGYGSIRVDHPFANAFNYVLVMAKIDGRSVLTDATEPLLLNNRIPTRCFNNKGLAVNSENIQWIALDFKSASYFNTIFRLVPDTSGIMKLEAHYSATEYEGFYYRNLLGDDKSKIEKEFGVSQFDFDPTSVFVENLSERKKPFNFSFEQEGHVETINGKMYINPFLGQGVNDNPLKQKVRTYPVDIVFPKMHSFKSEIVIPEGYEVSYKPEDKIVDNDLYRLNYSTLSDGTRLIVSFSYLFKSAVYKPEVYDRIKRVFNDIMKLSTDKIVLAPKSVETSSAGTNPETN